MSLMFFHIFLFTPSLLSSFPLPNSPPYLPLSVSLSGIGGSGMLSATNLANYFKLRLQKISRQWNGEKILKKVITFTKDKITIYIYIYTVHEKVTMWYSNYSVVSFPCYSTSTVISTVMGILV